MRDTSKVILITVLVLLFGFTGIVSADITSIDFFSEGNPSVGVYNQEFLKSYVNIDPDLTRGYNFLVDLRFNDGRKILEKVASDPKKEKQVRAEAYTFLGYAYINLHYLDKAEEVLNKAIQLNPRDSMAYFFLANIHYVDNDFENTKKCLLKAIECRPNFVSALRMLAETYKDEGKLDEATLYYNKIINVLPNSGYYHYQYYKVTEQNKKYDETVKTLIHMKQLQPKFLLNNIYLGEAYVKMGRFDDAKKEFREVLEQDEKFTRAYEGLAKVYKAQGDLNEAFYYAKKAESLEPTNRFVVSLIGEIERENAKNRRQMALITLFLLFSIAGTVALIYFYTSHRRKKYIITVIQSFNKSIDSIYDQNTLYNFLLNFFVDLGGSAKGLFLLFNRQNSQLTARESIGVDKEQLRNFNLYAGDELTNWLTNLKRYLLPLSEIEKDEQFEEVFPSLKDRLKEMKLNYVLPLREKNAFVGFIVVDGFKARDRILPNEHDLLMAISTTSAQAISTLTLYESSITDELTGLYNKRHFWQNLTAEIKRSERYGQPVSLLTLDIDNFKRLNDTYGHPQGDRILRELGQLVINTFRDGIDIGARIGGEEFAAILPATEASKAVLAAERLRKAVHEHEFPGFPEGSNQKVTISMGAATYPTHALSTKELVEKSDEALYVAKRTGKDRVCLIDSAKDAPQPVDLDSSLQRQVTPTAGALLDETGLFSRAYFDERIAGEVKRSERHSRSVSLLLAKPDTSIPDNERNILFKEIASILHGNLRRGIDVPARLDKGTVAILLPETDHNRAAQIARRIKQLVEQLPVEINGGGAVTFSIGVSNYPNFGRTEESLMESARQALKMCQQMGGNRALIATPL